MAGPVDCPECGSARSVERGLCQVCYAEFDEPGAAGLPPAAPSPLRLSDVVQEIHLIAALAARGEGDATLLASRRAEAMILELQQEFLEAITGPH